MSFVLFYTIIVGLYMSSFPESWYIGLISRLVHFCKRAFRIIGNEWYIVRIIVKMWFAFVRRKFGRLLSFLKINKLRIPRALFAFWKCLKIIYFCFQTSKCLIYPYIICLPFHNLFTFSASKFPLFLCWIKVYYHLVIIIDIISCSV